MKSAFFPLLFITQSLYAYYKLLTHICSGGGTVDFQEFVGGLSAFSSRGGREEKLRCTCLGLSLRYPFPLIPCFATQHPNH